MTNPADDLPSSGMMPPLKVRGLQEPLTAHESAEYSRLIAGTPEPSGMMPPPRPPVHVSADRLPPPPAELIGALHGQVHLDLPGGRAAKSVKHKPDDDPSHDPAVAPPLVDLEELARLEAAATPGPWRLRPTSSGGMILRRGHITGEEAHAQSHLQIYPAADARLIAAT